MKQAKSWPKFKRKNTNTHAKQFLLQNKPITCGSDDFMGRSSQMDWFVVHGYCKSNRTEQSSKEESYYFFLIALQLSTFNISISDVRICEKFDFGRISNCTVYPNVYKSLCTESESCCFFVCLLSPVNNITPKKKQIVQAKLPENWSNHEL